MEICYNEQSAWRINEHVELPNRGNDHIQHKRHMDKVKGFIPILSDRANRQNEGDRICQTGSDSQLLPREIGNIINSNESGKCLDRTGMDIHVAYPIRHLTTLLEVSKKNMLQHIPPPDMDPD